MVNYYRYNILSQITSGTSTSKLILIVLSKDGDEFASKPGLVFVNMNATPVRVTLIRVSGNPDQRTRIRTGTHTRVCVYAPWMSLHISALPLSAFEQTLAFNWRWQGSECTEVTACRLGHNTTTSCQCCLVWIAPTPYNCKKIQFERLCKGQNYKTAEIILLCHKVMSLFHTEPFTCELVAYRHSLRLWVVITSVTVANTSLTCNYSSD